MKILKGFNANSHPALRDGLKNKMMSTTRKGLNKK